MSFTALGKLAEQFIVEGVTSKIYVTKPQQQKPFTLKVGRFYQRLEPDKSVRCFCERPWRKCSERSPWGRWTDAAALSQSSGFIGADLMWGLVGRAALISSVTTCSGRQRRGHLITGPTKQERWLQPRLQTHIDYFHPIVPLPNSPGRSSSSVRSMEQTLEERKKRWKNSVSIWRVSGSSCCSRNWVSEEPRKQEILLQSNHHIRLHPCSSKLLIYFWCNTWSYISYMELYGIRWDTLYLSLRGNYPS